MVRLTNTHSPLKEISYFVLPHDSSVEIYLFSKRVPHEVEIEKA